MRISFILTCPKIPENIGAAARALKTMGFTDLRLVNPGDHRSNPARWLAHGAEDILESAQVFDSIATATTNIDFLIGTSSKKRPSKNENISARKLAQLLKSKGKTIRSVGILFGTEDRGLSNAQLADCDILSHIPMKQAQPSLNLAQAVMIYAYELTVLNRRKFQYSAPPPTDAAYRKLKQNVAAVLDQLGMADRLPIRNRIIERLAILNEKDTHLILSISKYLRDYFDKSLFGKNRYFL
jgi:tRNA/rRNA methyltransferase